MKWISSQPATNYYAWQVEVYLHNFIKKGINPKDIHVLFTLETNEVPSYIEKLSEKYKEVEFFCYPDNRINSNYIPSIYFNAVKQHFRTFPALETETIMFHDSDTILLKEWKNDNLMNDDVWYFSNTNTYINYDYIISKGDDIYNGMLDIVGLDESIPKLNNSNSGGAQHLIKNSTYEFWEKVENDSIKLYEFFCKEEPHYIKRHESDYPIQKWTAGMWSLLWNSWKFNKEVRVSDEMNFCWATDGIQMMEGKQFLHNAGVTYDRLDLFFKGQWIDNLPYHKNLQVDKNYCSYEYYKEIQEVEKVSPLTNLYK